MGLRRLGRGCGGGGEAEEAGEGLRRRERG